MIKDGLFRLCGVVLESVCIKNVKTKTILNHFTQLEMGRSYFKCGVIPQMEPLDRNDSELEFWSSQFTQQHP